MEKLLYNEEGSIAYINAPEPSILQMANLYAYCVDLPVGITRDNYREYHVEAGVIVPGAWTNPVPEEAPSGSSVSWLMQVSDSSITIKNIPPTASGVMEPGVQGTNILALKSSITTVDTMEVSGEIQVWNTAMSVSFIVLIVAFRSYSCDVVKHNDVVYICTEEHTSSSVLEPGTNEGATVWCPCGDADPADGISEWATGNTYSEGDISFLGTPPAFVSMFQQSPPQMFTSIKCLSRDYSLPDESFGITEVYYGFRAYALSDTGGGTTYSDLITLFGTPLLPALQSITITKV